MLEFQNTEEDIQMPVKQRTLLIFGVICVLLVIAGLLAYVFWSNRANEPAVTLTETPADTTRPGSQSEVISATGLDHEFQLEYVSQAKTQIVIEPATADMKVTDVADYMTRKDKAEVVNKVYAAERDRAYELTFASEERFEDFLRAVENPAVLYQLHDELMYLASYFSAQSPVEPLYTQSDAIVLLAPIKADPFVQGGVVVYPSQRAAEGFFVAEIMSQVDPDNAQEYQAQATAFAERGILYGQYGISSVAAAQSLVAQYFTLMQDNDPTLLTFLATHNASMYE